MNEALVILQIVGPLIVALVASAAVAKHKLSDTVTDVKAIEGRLSTIETWKAESKGRIMECQTTTKEKFGEDMKAVDNRVDGAFRRLDETRAEQRLLDQEQTHIKESITRVESDIHDIKSDVSKILAKLGGMS